MPDLIRHPGSSKTLDSGFRRNDEKSQEAISGRTLIESRVLPARGCGIYENRAQAQSSPLEQAGHSANGYAGLWMGIGQSDSVSAKISPVTVPEKHLPGLLECGWWRL